MNLPNIAVAGVLLLAAGATHAQGASVPAAIARDLQARSPAVTWPHGLHPEEADLFAHNQIDIARPCAQVWQHVAHAGAWPTWYANSADVQVRGTNGLLAQETYFEWKTFGLPIRSSVFDYEEGRRLGWFGHGPGMYAFHTWLLEPAAGGCRVTTEEITNGPAARKWRLGDPGALHEGHELWLKSLKQKSES
jgi:hypothetical protein